MKIKAGILERLSKEARLAQPLECCGLLWTQGQGPIVCHTSYPGPLFRQRFEIQDTWLLQQHYRGRRNGLTVQGYYHSHLDSAACPSSRDLAGHPAGSICVIVTPGGAARAFKMEGAECHEQVIETF